MDAPDPLAAVLRDAQLLGMLGDRPIGDAIAHAHEFVAPLVGLAPGARVLDLGSGGGLPGLVLATELTACRIVLLDRRQKRTDFLVRAVARLGLANAEVWCRDAQSVAEEIRLGREAAFDAVTARGFGPPEPTLRLAVDCTNGPVVISEPPAGDRWPGSLLADLGRARRRVGAVAVFEPVPPGPT